MLTAFLQEDPIMATPAQIEANQANGRRSHGPRTAEGKARSSANSLRHGFCSQSVLLPGDDPAEYQAMLDELRDHFGPADLTEERTVREMADAEWRLRRARQHQETLLTDACEELAARNPTLDAAHLQLRAFDHLLAHSNTLAVLMRYETKFERQYDRAYREWMAYQKRKDQVEARVAPVSQRPFETPSPQELVKHLPPDLQERFSRLVPQRSAANTILPSEPNPAPAIARNAPCPCGSGAKFKRCCGRNAPPASPTAR
jgi:uncharacterized protein YecA (UPF0149 family)